MSDDKVVSLNGGEIGFLTAHRAGGGLVPVENVIAGAADAGLSEVVVLGRYDDGEIFMATSHNHAYTALLLVEAQGVIGRNARLR